MTRVGDYEFWTVGNKNFVEHMPTGRLGELEDGQTYSLMNGLTVTVTNGNVVVRGSGNLSGDLTITIGQ